MLFNSLAFLAFAGLFYLLWPAFRRRDLRAFAARFHEAGGAWIDVDRDGYSCYDGLHLTEAGARAFSRDLARALAAELAR